MPSLLPLTLGAQGAAESHSLECLPGMTRDNQWMCISSCGITPMAPQNNVFGSLCLFI